MLCVWLISRAITFDWVVLLWDTATDGRVSDVVSPPSQGTMEEKIYERQVTKETLSQRVIDEHQLDRHFTFADLQELYRFRPDRLDDPEAPKRPTPAVPKVWCMKSSIV